MVGFCNLVGVGIAPVSKKTAVKTKDRGNDVISIVKHKILNKKQCDLSRFVCHLSVAIL